MNVTSSDNDVRVLVVGQRRSLSHRSRFGLLNESDFTQNVFKSEPFKAEQTHLDDIKGGVEHPSCADIDRASFSKVEGELLG